VRVSQLDYDLSLKSLAWVGQGEELLYAIAEWDGRSFDVEPRNWPWYLYNVAAEQAVSWPPPGTSLFLQARQTLALTPFLGQDSSAIPPDAMVYESPYGDQIIFTPFGASEETWLANKNGSNLKELDVIGIAYATDWSSDGKWVILSRGRATVPGAEDHYLASTDGNFIALVGTLIEIDDGRIIYVRPRFSPDSQYLVYGGSEVADSTNYSHYRLYLLDLETLESRLISNHFGQYQWTPDSKSLYVLTNEAALILQDLEEWLATSPQESERAALYRIDLTPTSAQETLLADGIEYFPTRLGSWYWGYSPELHAIAATGLQFAQELGILLLPTE
jgi:hypothetical protein